MIRSKYFWASAILLTAIPFLVLDIPKHYMDWQRDELCEIPVPTCTAPAK